MPEWTKQMPDHWLKHRNQNFVSAAMAIFFPQKEKTHENSCHLVADETDFQEKKPVG